MFLGESITKTLLKFGNFFNGSHSMTKHLEYLSSNQYPHGIKPRRTIAGRLMKCNATKYWNSLPQSITYQKTHGEFKNEFYNFKISSYRDSSLNFAPIMFG